MPGHALTLQYRIDRATSLPIRQIAGGGAEERNINAAGLAQIRFEQDVPGWLPVSDSMPRPEPDSDTAGMHPTYEGDKLSEQISPRVVILEDGASGPDQHKLKRHCI